MPGPAHSEAASLRRGDSTRLFVYGSLLRGEINHWRIARCPFLGEVATEPGLALVDLGPYPGMIKGGAGSVCGELYEVDAATLADLDILEEHPDRYWRTTIRLVGRGKVSTYLLRKELAEGFPKVRSGDWRRR